jgi:starch phosphorylase
MDAESIKQDLLRHLEFTLGELPRHVDSDWEPYVSLALAVRDRLMERWIRTHEAYYEHDAKRVYYLSLEFLMGRTLGNSLVNLGLYDESRRAVADLGYDLETLREAEWDAGLGNGGLGRLAACFLDSLATLQMPAYGYGIRYDYGIFHQRIVEGAQVETPDAWLRYGNPWEIPRSADQFEVQFYGRVETRADDAGRLVFDWVDTESLYAMPYDTPIPGYRNATVNTLRLWSARASQEFDLRYFNEGDYQRAVERKAQSENITKVLYPNDNVFEGRELRLKQEYLLVSATLQDIIRRYKKHYRMYDAERGLRLFDRFAERTAIQLNDTHPALAVPELMRLLVDVEGLGWDEAWALAVATFGYTNHTVMPEALERWPVALLGRVLPRHLQIIFEINHRFLDDVRARGGDDALCRRLSLIEEDGERRVRMAHLAIVGSHSVNGVAALHTEILKRELFRDFHALWPERFNNKTNGITQRRWLRKANPSLATLITDAIGDRWVTDLNELHRLDEHVGDTAFVDAWRATKQRNKERLAHIAMGQYRHRGLTLSLDPASMFDCQVKRIHEYKRQLLNVLHVITQYHRILDAPNETHVPRAAIFAGKAAPGYPMAKLIIRLINAVADVVNGEPAIGDRLKVVFLADYRVSLAENIFPAADLSEQISTAGTEASGTGNMKFALNGALTIGTMDGANIEIADEVGAENIFIFGLRADEVAARRPRHDPWACYHGDAELHRVLDAIAGGAFSSRQPDLFQPIVRSLLEGGDPYLLLADYGSYVNCQRQVSRAYRDERTWARMSIANVAGMGRFSTDRTIRQYADEIWGVRSVSP